MAPTQSVKACPIVRPPCAIFALGLFGVAACYAQNAPTAKIALAISNGTQQTVAIPATIYVSAKCPPAHAAPCH